MAASSRLAHTATAGGRLGHGDQSSQRTPRLVTALLREMRVVQIAAGDANSLALDVDGVV